MTGGGPVAEEYLRPMTEVKNGRMSTAWRLVAINEPRIEQDASPGPTDRADRANCLGNHFAVAGIHAFLQQEAKA